MNKMKEVAGLVAVLVIGCIVAPTFGALETKTWDQVPAAVQATILANGGKAGPVDLERTLIDGKAVYEAPAKDKNGNMVDLVVLEDGKLVEVKTDAASDFVKDQAARQAKKAAKQATPEAKGAQGGSNVDIKLPDVVTKTFKKTFPKGEIFKLDVEEENGVTVYDIEFKDGAIEKETDITADGTMLEFTVVVEAKAVPKAAMKVIQKAAEGATIKRIEHIEMSHETKDGKTIKLSKPVTHYAVGIAKGDQTAEIVVAPDGTVVEPATWGGAGEAKPEKKEAKPEKKEAKGGKKAAKQAKGEPVEKAGKIEGFASKFAVDKANLTNLGKNPYFLPLEPGYRLALEGGGATLTVTVTRNTKLVDGVETRVIEEREEKDGQPIEISQNYFAIDKTDNAVYYFGEDVDVYKNGKVVSHGGAWLSGVGGAKFGMLMPGKPKVGDKFQQEIAPKVAMDRCEIAAIGEEIKTPAGTFKDCLRTTEGSTLESATEDKVYAPGVGLVKDEEFLLVKITKTAAKKKAAKEKK